jgi:hypothetical protein
MAKNITEQQKPANILKVTLSIGNQTVSAIGELPEVAMHSHGPMSLYSACMSLVQELSQGLYVRAKEKQWNGLAMHSTPE